MDEEWTNGWTVGRTDGWTNGMREERMEGGRDSAAVPAHFFSYFGFYVEYKN